MATDQIRSHSNLSDNNTIYSDALNQFQDTHQDLRVSQNKGKYKQFDDDYNVRDSKVHEWEHHSWSPLAESNQPAKLMNQNHLKP